MATAALDIPHGWDVNTSEAVLSNDPTKIYREYDYMRSKCPVAHVDKHNGYWILTKYDDIKWAASDTSTFVSSVCAIVPADPRGIRRPPLKFDGKEHTPYRTALDRTLKPARLKRLEPILAAHVDEALDVIIKQGQGDIYRDFGAPFCAFVEGRWLNLNDEDAQALADNVPPFVQAWRTGDWDMVKRSSDGFYEIANRVMAAREKELLDPEEDPASSLLMERDHDGNPLDKYHLIGCIRQSLIVAMVAPSILNCAMVKHLGEDKELQNKLRASPELIPAAVEEFVRLYTPYRGFARTALRPTEISGQTVPTGEPITITYAAANRDPAQFDQADKFILNRENISTHLGFGRGRHRCAGMALARMMLKVFLEVLLRKTSDFEVDGECEFARLPEVGMISCPMKFMPAA